MAITTELISRILRESLPVRGDGFEVAQGQPGACELTGEGWFKVVVP